MEVTTLKTLRLITPAILILIGYGLLGYFSGLWSIPDIQIEDARFSPIVLIIGFFYYVLGVQKKTNTEWQNKVSNNIITQLYECSGVSKPDEEVKWSEVKDIFYGIIDKDPSLSKRSKIAYFNGYMWTSSADAFVISFIWMLVSFIPFALKVGRSETAVICFFSLSILALLASKALTQRQIEIGNDQLRFICKDYQSDIKRGLERIDSVPSN